MDSGALCPLGCLTRWKGEAWEPDTEEDEHEAPVSWGTRCEAVISSSKCGRSQSNMQDMRTGESWRQDVVEDWGGGNGCPWSPEDLASPAMSALMDLFSD